MSLTTTLSRQLLLPVVGRSGRSIHNTGSRNLSSCWVVSKSQYRLEVPSGKTTTGDKTYPNRLPTCHRLRLRTISFLSNLSPSNINTTQQKQQQLRFSSSKSGTKEKLFDPLAMPSSTVLKQVDIELEPEEIALKRALEQYQQVIQQEGGNDPKENPFLQDALDDLNKTYQDLGYWEEALGIEQTLCNLYYSQLGVSLNNDGTNTMTTITTNSTTTTNDAGDAYADSIHTQGKLYLRQEDFRNSHDLYQQALEYFTESGNETQQGHVLMSLAGWHYFRGDLESALQLLQESEPLLDNNPTLLIKNLDNAGLVLRCMEEYGKALEKYEQAMQILGQDNGGTGTGNDDSSFETRMALGMHMADMRVALEELDSALELYHELLEPLENDPTSTNAGTRGVLLHNIANIHAKQGEYELALEEFNQALQLKAHSGGETNPEVAKTWNAMGALYGGVLDQKSQAMECFQQALNIARSNADNEDSDPDVLAILKNMTVLQKKPKSSERNE